MRRPKPTLAGHRHVREERVGLEDQADVAPLRRQAVDARSAELNLAAVRLGDAGDHAHHRGLAAARRSEQGDELALGDVEVETIDRDRRAERLAETVEADARHSASRRKWRRRPEKPPPSQYLPTRYENQLPCRISLTKRALAASVTVPTMRGRASSSYWSCGTSRSTTSGASALVMSSLVRAEREPLTPSL